MDNGMGASQQVYSRELTGRIEEALVSIDNELEQLEKRLGDVISPAEPTPDKTKSREDRQPGCDLDERLLTLTRTAEGCLGRLQYLRHRIQV